MELIENFNNAIKTYDKEKSDSNKYTLLATIMAIKEKADSGYEFTIEDIKSIDANLLLVGALTLMAMTISES